MDSKERAVTGMTDLVRAIVRAEGILSLSLQTAVVRMVKQEEGQIEVLIDTEGREQARHVIYIPTPMSALPLSVEVPAVGSRVIVFQTKDAFFILNAERYDAFVRSAVSEDEVALIAACSEEKTLAMEAGTIVPKKGATMGVFYGENSATPCLVEATSAGIRIQHDMVSLGKTLLKLIETLEALQVPTPAGLSSVPFAGTLQALAEVKTDLTELFSDIT